MVAIVRDCKTLTVYKKVNKSFYSIRYFCANRANFVGCWILSKNENSCSTNFLFSRLSPHTVTFSPPLFIFFKMKTNWYIIFVFWTKLEYNWLVKQWLINIFLTILPNKINILLLTWSHKMTGSSEGLDCEGKNQKYKWEL